MKINELMVGDWVNYKSQSSGKLSPIKIENIYGVEFNCEVEYWNIKSGYSISDTEPIKLTEEILVKNGFEKNYNDDAPAEECYFYRLFAKPCGWLDIDAFGLEEELGAEFTYHDININYVHQLQHLLRLAGVQKEIEL